MTSRKVQDASAKKSEHVRVFVRARPLQPGEAAAPLSLNERQVTVRTKANSRGQSQYAFKRVFDTATTQHEVFEQACHPMVMETLKGFSCTIFAYGQTNSGKTHSMMGDLTSTEHMGLTPRASKTLFNELMKSSAHYTVRLSCVELYKEEFYDMLSDPTTGGDKRAKLKLFQDGQRGVIMKGMEELVVSSPNEVVERLNSAIQRRQTASTGMNNRSSRSHFIATLTVTIKEETMTGEDLFKIGKLHLVDLAGSESAKRADTTGTDRQSEAAAINKSLLTLGRVIHSLSKNESHTPYRESALTRLLQEALGGKSKTTIITTISLAKANIDETISTLEYASSAKQIENDPELNRVLSGKQIVCDYEQELVRLRTELHDQRNGTGVFISEERYGMMQARLKELEDDAVVSKEKMAEMQAGLAALQEEFDAAMADMTAKQRAKNILLGHHQYAELEMADYIVEAASRETALRGVIAARDAQESKNLGAVAEATEHQQAGCSDMEDALNSTAQATAQVKDHAVAAAYTVSEALETHLKAGNAAGEQGQLKIQALQAAVERCQGGFLPAHAQKAHEVREAANAMKDDAMAKIEALVTLMAEGNSAVVAEHTARSTASLDDILQRFLIAASSAAADDAAAAGEGVSAVLREFKAEVASHFCAHAADVERGVGEVAGEVTGQAEAVAAQAGAVHVQVEEMAQATAGGVRDGVAAAGGTLSGAMEQMLRDCKGDVDAKVARHHEMLVVLEEREKAAATEAAEQRDQAQKDAAEVQAAAMREVEQVFARMNAQLQEVHARSDATERALRTTISKINAERAHAQTALRNDLSATHNSIEHAIHSALAVHTDAAAAVTHHTAHQLKATSQAVGAHANTAQETLRQAQARLAALQAATGEANSAGSDALTKVCERVSATGEASIGTVLRTQKRKRESSAEEIKAVAAQAVAASLEKLAQASAKHVQSCRDAALPAQTCLTDGTQRISQTAADVQQMGQEAMRQVVADVGAGASGAGECAARAREALGQCLSRAQLYPQVMEQGMAEGEAEIMSGVHAASCVLLRLRETVAFLSDTAQPHAGGMTPAPARADNVPETTADYPAILAAFDADPATAAETPQPKRHRLEALAGRAPLPPPPVAQHVDPQAALPPSTPGNGRLSKTIEGTPKTPLTARSGNIAMP